jgi:hypothetical protein
MCVPKDIVTISVLCSGSVGGISGVAFKFSLSMLHNIVFDWFVMRQASANNNCRALELPRRGCSYRILYLFVCSITVTKPTMQPGGH